MCTSRLSEARSAARALTGLVLVLAGVFLAFVGFGVFSPVFGQSKNASSGDRKVFSESRSLSAAGQSRPNDNTGAFSPADDRGRFVYLVEFAEPGLLSQAGITSGRSVLRSPQAQTNREHLVAQQAAHVQAIGQAIGRSLDVTHHFLATHSGVAARLTPDEAAIVRGLPGIAKIEREQLYHLDTFRSPTFIGADTIWDGSNVPGGIGTRGAGIVIAVLDTGIEAAHPSFANDAQCGHGVGGVPNKLLSALDCSSTDVTGLCNGPDPSDPVNHGTHVASTAGGNTVGASAMPPPNPPPPFTQISGVAPCASIRSYRVCPNSSCPNAELQAGMNSVLLHGDVDVMNFSISGGTDPWHDNDRRKLDLVEAGVFVAASAGNTGVDPNPVGNVHHLGPWVMAVAASTRDREFIGNLSAAGPGAPPPETQNIHMLRGSDSPFGNPLTSYPIRHFIGQPDPGEGCTSSSPPFPSGFFNGAAALIHRGGCDYTEKITNAFNAGATMVLMRNSQPGTLPWLTTPGQPNIPAYSMDQEPGDALVAFVDANASSATINFNLLELPGDVLAGFSLRGPAPVPFQNVTKPDITGPGVEIYAAFPFLQNGYGILRGTSMSTPHTSGSAALVRSVHPTWTVSEVHSALMMTGFEGGTKEDTTTPWDADDVGSGRLDLTKAARAGLVMDETIAHFLAADPNMGGDPRTLNIASVRNMSCSPSCTWTRTLRNTRTVATSWHASGMAITPGFKIEVLPATFSFTGGLSETQQIQITVTPTTDLTGAVAFGKVVLSSTGSGVSGSGNAPDEHITVAIKGSPNGTPTPTQTPALTPTPTPALTPTPTPLPAQALNISTRMRVDTGNNVLIGGFIITGTAPKIVAIRGVGPSLGVLGVPDALSDPALELHNGTGALLMQNDNWQDDATQAAQLTALGLGLQNPNESGIVASLQPNAYSAILAGKNGGTGVGLVEVYDTNQAASSQLANISTRGFVLTGGNVMIGGFILGGNNNTRVVVRGIGPSLAQVGVPIPLADPTLELHDSNGAVLVSNDNWQDDSTSAAQLTALGLAPQSPLESGIYISLPPGAFTAILAGKNGGTGVGLVEVYNVH